MNSPAQHYTDQARIAQLEAALVDTELRCTQARIASTIGKKKGKDDFLRNELERIAQHARAAIESGAA